MEGNSCSHFTYAARQPGYSRFHPAAVSGFPSIRMRRTVGFLRSEARSKEGSPDESVCRDSSTAPVPMTMCLRELRQDTIVQDLRPASSFGNRSNVLQSTIAE